MKFWPKQLKTDAHECDSSVMMSFEEIYVFNKVYEAKDRFSSTN